MNNFRKVFRNTAILFGSEIILKILGFFWTIFLARSLGVDLFGRYSFVTAFISIFAFLPDLGIGIIVIRDIAKHKEKTDELIGNSLIINTFFALITSFIILITANVLHHTKDIQSLIFIAAVTLLISTIRSVGIFYFDGMEKMHYSAFLNTLNTILLYIFAVSLFLSGAGLFGIFIGMLVGTIVSLFITWSVIMKKFIIPKVSFKIKLIKHLFFEGLPLGIASFASVIYSNIDTVILAQYLGEKSAGIYNVAIPFSFALIGLLNVPFIVALFPTLSRLSIESHDRFNSAYLKALGIIALWSFPAAIGVNFFAFLIPIIFGVKYTPAIEILKIHIFMVPFASLTALLYKILIILGKQNVYLLMSIAGAVINIILNMVLIPQLHIKGAAYAAVITQVVLFVCYFFIVQKFLREYKKNI